MKKVISLMLFCLMGCTNRVKSPDRIISISKYNSSEVICEFTTKGSGFNYGYFCDSCNKFKIGDSIKIIRYDR